MANPHLGEVEFSVEGTTYKLSFSINALCELEEALGEGIAELFGIMSGDPAKMRLKTIRVMFWAGLRDHQPKITVIDAGKLLQALGVGPATELVNKAVTLAFPSEAGSQRPLAATTH